MLYYTFMKLCLPINGCSCNNSSNNSISNKQYHVVYSIVYLTINKYYHMVLFVYKLINNIMFQSKTNYKHLRKE